jgi:hypothetical protein
MSTPLGIIPYPNKLSNAKFVPGISWRNSVPRWKAGADWRARNQRVVLRDRWGPSHRKNEGLKLTRIKYRPGSRLLRGHRFNRELDLHHARSVVAGISAL